MLQSLCARPRVVREPRYQARGTEDAARQLRCETHAGPPRSSRFRDKAAGTCAYRSSGFRRDKFSRATASRIENIVKQISGEFSQTPGLRVHDDAKWLLARVDHKPGGSNKGPECFAEHGVAFQVVRYVIKRFERNDILAEDVGVG